MNSVKTPLRIKHIALLFLLFAGVLLLAVPAVLPGLRAESAATYKVFVPLAFKPEPPSLVNGDFEQGPQAWSEHSTRGGTIIRTSFGSGISAHSGAWAAWLGGLHNDISTISQQVTVPVNAPYLTYWRWIKSGDVCGYDFGDVYVNGMVVSSFDLCFLTSNLTWSKRVINLSGFAGQTVLLEFETDTDGSFVSSLYIDDISFQSSAQVAQDDQIVADEDITASPALKADPAGEAAEAMEKSPGY